MNLFANLSDVFNSDVVSRVATYIDEPAEKTRKAINALVYTVVGGLMKRTTTEIGVNQLYRYIQKGNYDGSLLEDLNVTLRDPSRTNTLITQGNEVISHLLPAMKSSIGTMISSYANIRNSSAISLLGLTTTVVLHVLGKQTITQKIDADGLAALLFSERDALVNAVPEEFFPQLVDKVGLQQVVAGVALPARRTTVDTSVRPTTTTTTRPAVTYDYTEQLDKDTGNFTKWGFGALIVLALAAGGYYIYQNTQNYSGGQHDSEDIAEVVSDSLEADTVTRSLAVPTATTPRAPGLATAPTSATTAGGALNPLITAYLNDATQPKGKTFRLPGIAFEPNSFSMTAGSQATINELTTLLKTYPNLQIQLIGYANDALGGGFTNKSLSFKTHESD